MKKLNLSLLIYTTSILAIILGILSHFYIGINIVGLWDISKFYVPIAISLILIDRLFNKELNKKYFFRSVVFIIIFVLLLVLELYRFWY